MAKEGNFTIMLVEKEDRKQLWVLLHRDPNYKFTMAAGPPMDQQKHILAIRIEDMVTDWLERYPREIWPKGATMWTIEEEDSVFGTRPVHPPDPQAN